MASRPYQSRVLAILVGLLLLATIIAAIDVGKRSAVIAPMPANEHSAPQLIRPPGPPQAPAVPPSAGAALVRPISASESRQTRPGGSTSFSYEVGYITIPDAGPIELAYDAINGNVYVATSNSGSSHDNVTVINASSSKVVASIPYDTYPGGVTVDTDNGNVFITGSNKVTIINGSTNSVMRTVTVPDLVLPGGITLTPFLRKAAYDSANENLYVVDEGEYLLHVLNTTSWRLAPSIGTGLSPIDISLNAVNGYLYVTNAGSYPGWPGNVTVADPRNGSNITSILPGYSPLGITTDPEKGTVYTDGNINDTTEYASRFTIINESTNSILTSTVMRDNPWGMAFDSSNGYVYVAINFWNAAGSGNVSVMNGSSGRLVGNVTQMYGPYGITYDPANRCMYVADATGSPYSYGEVSVICPDPLHAALSASKSSVETGSPVTFAANVSGGLPPFYSHSLKWSFGDGITQYGNGTTETYAFSAAGIYQVNVTATDSGGYTASATVFVNVTQGPIVSAIFSSRASLDAGQSVTLKVSAMEGSWFYVAADWAGLPAGCSGPARFNSTTFGVGCTPTSASTYSITATVTDSLGGISRPSPALVLSVLPDPVVTLSSNRSVLDVGQSLDLTASANLGSGGYSYGWSGLPPGCPSAGPKLTCRPSHGGTYSIGVGVVDSNGFSVGSASVSLAVNPALILRSPAISPNATVDEVVTFVASTSGGTAPLNFTWYFGDGQALMGRTVAHVYSAAGNYTVRLTVSDASGTRNGTTVTVEVTNPVPPPSVGTRNASGIPPWEVYAVVGGVAGLAVMLAVVPLVTRRTKSKVNGR